MTAVSFSVSAEDLSWIDGIQDDPEDLCAHGIVTVLVGDEILRDDCCASASALRMLRTLTEDHVMDDSESGQQMLPCCGHSMFPDESLENVYISGCCYGTDYAVRHEENSVVLVTRGGNQYTIRPEDYRREVLKFARQIEAFYHQYSPKRSSDDFDWKGYTAFQNEWKRRMTEGESAEKA